MKRRLLAILLCLCMAAGLLPTAAWAADDEVLVTIGNVQLTKSAKYYVNGEAKETAAEGEWTARARYMMVDDYVELTLNNLNTTGAITSGRSLEVELQGENKIEVAEGVALKTDSYVNKLTITGYPSNSLIASGGTGGIEAGEIMIKGDITITATGSEFGVKADVTGGNIEKNLTVVGGKLTGICTGSGYGLQIGNTSIREGAQVVGKSEESVGISRGGRTFNIDISNSELTGEGKTFGIFASSIQAAGSSKITGISSDEGTGIEVGTLVAKNSTVVEGTGKTGIRASSQLAEGNYNITVDLGAAIKGHGLGSGSDYPGIFAGSLQVINGTVTGEGDTGIRLSGPADIKSNAVTGGGYAVTGNGRSAGIWLFGDTTLSGAICGTATEGNGIVIDADIAVSSVRLNGESTGSHGYGIQIGYFNKDTAALTVLDGEVNGTGPSGGILVSGNGFDIKSNTGSAYVTGIGTGERSTGIELSSEAVKKVLNVGIGHIKGEGSGGGINASVYNGPGTITVSGYGSVIGTVTGDSDYEAGVKANNLTIEGNAHVTGTGAAGVSIAPYNGGGTDSLLTISGNGQLTGTASGRSGAGVSVYQMRISDNGRLAGTASGENGTGISFSGAAPAIAGGVVKGKATGQYGVGISFDEHGGTITGGAVTAEGVRSGIEANNPNTALTISGGRVTATASGDYSTGISAYDMTVRGEGANVTATGVGSGISAQALKIQGGTVKGSVTGESGRGIAVSPEAFTIGAFKYSTSASSPVPVTDGDSSIETLSMLLGSPYLHINYTGEPMPEPTVEAVTVTPATASVAKGGTRQFTAEVSGTNDPAQTVIWSVTGGSASSISSDGLLTVGADEDAATLNVTATSTEDSTKSGTATVTVTATGSSSGSSGGSGGGSSNTTSNTTTNPDGSTTTTTENKATGTVTETTKAPDGSQTVVETKKDGTVTTTETDKDGNKTETVEKTDGSSVTTVKQTDGTTASVTTDADGKVEAEVKLTSAAVAAAQESGEAVALPIPAVQATRSIASAPAVTVKTNSSEAVKVEIPTANVTPGTVAVLMNADGTEEIIKSSVVTDDGVAAALPDSATVKIVDNSKDFADVSDAHWASDAVDFASARELFAGTSENSFSPEENMTRAMLMTVLARYDGTDTSGGETWYEKGMEWAVANGISDGSSPNAAITREQLAVMLYRYAGSPAAGGSLEGFSDADEISDYAVEAMRWAVENGIINGFGNGQLGPNALATRAQVAQMLKNFIEM